MAQHPARCPWSHGGPSSHVPCAPRGFTILGWRCSPSLLPALPATCCCGPILSQAGDIQRWGHPPCSRRTGTGGRGIGKIGGSCPHSGCRYGSWHPVLSCCVSLLGPSDTGNGPAASCARQTPTQGREGLGHAGSEDRRHTLK